MAPTCVNSGDTSINPVQALAALWAEIAEIDQTQRRLDQAEREAHERIDQLEAEILSREPASLDELLALVLVIHAELPKDGNEHLERALQLVARWLAKEGAAESSILRVYLGG
jgi:hypothetical protein